jgi:hypothetical protein
VQVWERFMLNRNKISIGLSQAQKTKNEQKRKKIRTGRISWPIWYTCPPAPVLLTSHNDTVLPPLPCSCYFFSCSGSVAASIDPSRWPISHQWKKNQFPSPSSSLQSSQFLQRRHLLAQATTTSSHRKGKQEVMVAM